MVREKEALEASPADELEELAKTYESRGLSPKTAQKVAEELTAHDALATHMRDELGISEVHVADPLQAALASGATFTVAGGVPLLGALLAPPGLILPTVLFVTVIALMALGTLGARAGAAPVLPSTTRVVGWGLFAMAVTAVVGKLFGVSV